MEGGGYQKRGRQLFLRKKGGRAGQGPDGQPGGAVRPGVFVLNEVLQARRDREFTFKATIGELLDLFGEENVKTVIEEKTADASYNPDYERTLDNVMGNWMMLVLFALAFALLSTLSLEMIDRDKR